MDNNFYQKEKNISFSIGRMILTLCMVMIAVVGGTFAWLTYSSKQSAMVLTIGNINDTQIKLSPYQVEGNITPGTDHTSGVSSEVEVSKGNSNSTSFALFYKINQLDTTLIDKGLSYTIVNKQTGVKVKEGKFSDLIDTSKPLPKEVIILDTNTDTTLSANTVAYYSVYLWVDSKVGNQNDIQNSTLDVELNGSIGSVLVGGVNTYGGVLTTTVNDAVIDNTTTYSYQWYSNTTNSTKGGTAIEGATSATYTVGNGLVGKYIYVVVTTSKGKTLSDVVDSTVSAKVIDVSKLSFGTVTKVYDGATSVPSGFALTANLNSGLLSGDTVTVSYTGATYNSSNVVEASKISVSGIALSGTDAGNYSLSATSYDKTGATITPKGLSLGAHSDIYNGTTSYARTFGTGIGSQNVALTYKPNTKNVGDYAYSTSAASGKYLVSMADGTGKASNYSITTGGTFTMNQKELDVSKFTYSPLTKVYDGTTTAPSGFGVTVTAAGGLISGDTVTVGYTSAVYNSAEVANANKITVSGMTITGTDAGNYKLSNTTYAKTGATITNATMSGGSVEITGSAIYGETLTAKVTNTNPTATYTYEWFINSTNSKTGGTSIGTTSTLVLGDNTFGKYIYVVVTASKTNYTTKTFSDITDATKNGSATVAARPITVTAKDYGKIYDGTALTGNGCDLTSGTLAFSHEIAGCTMTSASTITDVGSADNVLNVVNIYNDSKSGYVNNYYNVTKVKGKLTITAKQLKVASFTYSPITKIYDGTTTAPSGFKITPTTASGLVSGDTVTVSYTSAVYNSADVASATKITVTGMALGGTDAKNYSIDTTGYTKTGATITNATMSGGSVAVSGTNTWGQTLTATITNTTPTASYTCTWYSSTTSGATSGGTKITDATVSSNKCTYTIDKSLVGKYIYVTITASKANYTTKTFSDATDASANTTAAVAKQNLSVTATAYNGTYDGSEHYATIKVNSSAWDGKTIVSGTSTSYGTTVTSNGAYNTSYNLKPGYTNVTNATTVYYKVTGGTYYNDKTGTSTVTITNATLSGGSVAVSGTNTWGQTLTATITNTTPIASYTCTWYSSTTSGATSGGTKITDATVSSNKCTYTIDKSLVGKYIYVTITASKANYTTKTFSDATDASANATAAVAKQNLSVTATAYNGTYDGSEHYATIKVNSSAWDGKTIVSGTSTSYGTTVTSNGAYNTSYNLKPGYTNVTNATTVYYKVTGGTYYNDKTGTSTVTITKATLSGGSVTISGTNTWGQTLTATITDTTPTASYSCTWYSSTTSGATSGGTKVGNATVSSNKCTYTIDKSLVGKYIYVTVTALKTNYTTKTFSDATDASANTTAAVAKQNLSVTATAYNGSYDGSEHYATIKVNSSAWDGKTIVSGTSTSYGTTVTSNGAYNTSYNLKPGYTNVTNGSTVYYKVTGGTYYNDKTGTSTVTITRANASITASTESLALKYPTAGSFTYTYTGDGTVSCSSSSTSVATCSVDTTNKKVTVTPVSAGSLTITVTLSQGTNYTGATAVVMVNVEYSNYTITLDDDGADSAGTTTLYGKVGVGVYLDSSYSKKMTASSNAITVPTRKGYEFDGYYTEASGEGIQLISSSGFITSAFTNSLYSGNVTLYANWLEISTIAIYSEDDNSLMFYKSTTEVNVGDLYNGRTVTAIYSGFETDVYHYPGAEPWSEIKESVVKVQVVDVVSPVSTSFWFYGFKNVTSIDVSNLDVSNVENMQYMFGSVGYNATMLQMDLSGWDVSNVTNMQFMFSDAAYGATKLDIMGDLSGWNTSSVTNMQYMFYNVGYSSTNNWLLDLSDWDVSNVSTCNDFKLPTESRIISPFEYNVTYDANGGTGAPNSQIKTYGVSLTLSTIVPTRSGYVFKGWAITSDAENALYQPGGSYTSNASVKLYAVWRSVNDFREKFPVITRIDYNTFTYTQDGAVAYYACGSPNTPEDGNVTANSTFSFCSWTTATSTGDIRLSSPGTYYVWARDQNGNISNYSEISILPILRIQGTGTTLITRYDSTSSTTGTEFTSDNIFLLEGTPIWVKATLNSDVYEEITLKRDTIVMETSGDTFILSSGSRIISEAINYSATPTITRSDYNTFTYTASGAEAYYVTRFSSFTSDRYVTANSTFSLDSWTTATSTGDLNLFAPGTYYVWARDAAGNISPNCAQIAAYNVVREIDAGSSLITKFYYESENKEFYSNIIVLSGTSIWAKATVINNGYSVFLNIDDKLVDNPSSIKVTSNTTIRAVSYIKTYIVSYDANGGSGAPSNQSKNHGVDLTLSSTVPTRDGYTFLGWATDSNATSATYQPGDTYSTNAEATLYAVWSSYIFEVSSGSTHIGYANTFADAITLVNSNSGTITVTQLADSYTDPNTSVLTISVNIELYAKELYLDAQIQIDGSFRLMSGNVYNTGKNSDFGFLVNGYMYLENDSRLTAAWGVLLNAPGRLYIEADAILHSYNQSAISVFVDDRATDNIEGAVIELRGTVVSENHSAIDDERSAYNDYVFQGQIYTGATVTPSIIIGDDVYLYENAKVYSYNPLSYDLSDLGYDIYYPTGMSVSETTTTYELPVCHNCSTDSERMVEGYLSQVVPRVYTISYDANGGTGAPSSQTKSYGVDLILSDTVPTRDEYTFLGWSTSSTATSASYQPGGTWTLNASTTLYAVWQYNGSVTTAYSIGYDANGGSGAPNTQYKTPGVALTLSSTRPTRTNYTFLGWATSSSATSATYQPGGTYTADASVILYAVWQYNGSTTTYYKVCFDANGGTGAPGCRSQMTSLSLTLTTTEPTRDGYTFIGWSTSSTATSATYQPGGIYSAGVSTTLYAVWEANTYTVSYDANGGSGAPSSQTKTRNVDLTLSSTVPTRDGYTFLGWSTSSTATSATYSAGDTYSTNATVTLYAVWEAITYTVSYKACGGINAPSSQTKTHGIDLILSNFSPAKTSFSFQGWSTSGCSATSATYPAGGTYSTNASATMYAVWDYYMCATAPSVNSYKCQLYDANGATLCHDTDRNCWFNG